MNLDDIYSEVILVNSRTSKNRGELENPKIVLRGVNPSCGDDITLELQIENEVIKDIKFHGVGCAISQASTSLMIDLLKGKTLEASKDYIDTFVDMIIDKEDDQARLEKLEDAMAFENISHMPARVKCALLSWRTIEEEINK